MARVNLNLLLVFDAVMTEGSTTRAGKLLGLSQPAVSNSLAQLRHALDDPLFVRTAQGMVPTPRAVSLSASVSGALSQMKNALADRQGFLPASSDRIFRVGMSDYSALVLFSRILRLVRPKAPSVRISVQNIEIADVPRALDSDEVEICLGFPPLLDSWHVQEKMFDDEWVCARTLKPGASPTMSVDEYLDANHIVVGSRLESHVDKLLSFAESRGKTVVCMPYCLVAPLLEDNSGLLVTLPRRLALELGRDHPIQMMKLPFKTRTFAMEMVWHLKDKHDEGHLWLREVIRSASAAMSRNSTSAIELRRDRASR